MICLVTDRHRLSSGADAHDRLVELVAAAAGAGVDLIQIRERDLETDELTVLVAGCVDAVGGTAAQIVVNDRADVMLAAGAHGVHLRSDSFDATTVRRLLPPNAVLGRSVHGVEEAAAVSRSGGVNYLVFGTLFPTPSKRNAERLATLSELSAACRLTPVPVLAIGGITPETAAMALRAGAAGVAAIGLFVPPPGRPADAHVRSVVAGLRRAFDTCGASP